jgi:hypothetical protein
MRLRELAAALAVSLLAVACGGDPPAPRAPASSATHEDHRAPHGGSLLELGEEEAHVEVVHDPKAGVLTLHVYGKDLKSPVAVPPPTILLSAAGGPRTLTPTALDAEPGRTSATTWRLVDPALATDPLDGRLRITVNGKQHQTPLEPAGH